MSPSALYDATSGMRYGLKIRIADTLSQQAPDWVFVWADPYWSARWTPSTAPHPGMSSEFVVTLDLHPLHPASLELYAREKYMRDHNERRWQPTLCDTLKLHFHSQRADALEMRYAATIPLTSLRPGLSHTLGAWTTAEPDCDKTGQNAHGVDITLTVVYAQAARVRPMLIPSVLPDVAHHTGMKAVGNWVADVLGATYGEKCTGFINIRTVLQDRCMTTFFPDIPGIIQPQLGTTLPPTLAIYSVCNALRVHRISPSTFLRSTRDTGLVLRLVRDMLVPWTMCRLEGQYAADLWCGKACEDQPFTNSLKPGIRVWPIDDCEGRNQEACVHAVLMFVWIYLDRSQNQSSGVNAHFEAYPPNAGCLAFSGTQDPDFVRLLEVCYAVGELLHTRILSTHMAVGDVYFHKQLESHSFGLLLYTDESRGLYDGIVMETTAWDMTVDDVHPGLPCSLSSTQLSSMLEGIMKANASNKAMGHSLGIRHAATRSSRQGVYRGIYTGTDCLFFGKHGRTFGIQLDDLRGPLPALTSVAEIRVCPTAFRIQLLHFMRLAATGDSCWTLPSDSTAPTTQLLHDYSAYLAKIPAFARSLRPPPQPEAEYMHRMGSWGRLGAEHVIPDEAVDGIAPSCITAFIWKTDEREAMPQPLTLLLDTMTAEKAVYEHPCMHSTVFTFVTSPH